MKQLLITMTFVSLAHFACAADQPAERSSGERTGGPKPNVQAHEGVWKPIAAVLGGVRLPQLAVKAITLNITGHNYVVTVEGEKEPDKGTYALDTSTTPKRITIKSTDGPNRGRAFFAIYEMKDVVSMRVCYDLSGKDFPKEFKAPKGTQLYVVGYRRQIMQQPNDDPGPPNSDLPFVIGNREEPTETQLLAFAKSFCVAMRRQHDNADVPALRGYFDPRYLEEHALLDGDFRVQVVPIGVIHNIRMADDKRTLLCYVETGDRQKEAIRLRAVTREGRLYLLPPKAPDEKTQLVTPWILRMSL